MELVPDGAMLLQAQAIMVQMGRMRQDRLGINMVAQGAEASAASMAGVLTAMQAMLTYRAQSDPQWYAGAVDTG